MRCVSLQKIPLAMLLLAAFFLLGVAAGCVVSRRCAAATGAELQSYLEKYLAARAVPEWSASVAWQTLLCFFRAPCAVFLLGFAALGVTLIPAVCAAQGFLFSFSLFCFSSALGESSFFLLPLLFGVRLLTVLPCTLLLGSAGWEAARSLAALARGGGKRVKPAMYGKQCWGRFGGSCVCLLFGAALELWLVPRLLPFLLR